MNYLLVRSDFEVDVEQPVDSLVDKLKTTVHPKGAIRVLPDGGYQGNITESGFAIRRITARSKDSRPAVVVKGSFDPKGPHTDVRVSVRHGWHMILFFWILILIVLGILVDRLKNAKGWSGILILIGMAVLWGRILFRDVRQVRDEVTSLLTR